MNPSSLLIILMTAVWVSVTTLSAATTNAAASIGPSVVGQVPVYTDTSGQLMTPSSSLTNITLSTPSISLAGTAFIGSVLTRWVDTNNVAVLQWKKPPEVYEWAGTTAGIWTTLSFNSGTAATATSDGIDGGYESGSTGSLTNGGGGLRLDTTAFFFGTNFIALTPRVKTPTSLSTSVDAYELYIGFGDTTGDAEPVDGAYFYYLHTVSNGVWCAKTSSNSNRTFASGAGSSPPTVAAATVYDFIIEGNMNVVNFWVSSDLGVTYQWIGYSDSNIPNTSARLFGANIYIRKVGGSTGTNNRQLLIGRAAYWPY